MERGYWAIGAICGIVLLVAFVGFMTLAPSVNENLHGKSVEFIESTPAPNAPSNSEPSIDGAPAKSIQYIGPPATGPSPPEPATSEPTMVVPVVQEVQDAPVDRPVQSYDVIVAGAGPGGIGAAIQASRLGMHVLIIEESDQVGGQMMPVPNMDGGNTLPAGSGIYTEFKEKMRKYYGDRPVGTCYWTPLTNCYEPSAVRTVLNQMLADANVEVRYRTKIASVQKENGAVIGITTNTRQMIRSKVLIDATEYGDVIPLTGAAYRIGNSISGRLNANSCVDDITYVAIVKKYPNGVPAQLQMRTAPPGYEQYRTEFARTVALNGKNLGQGYPINFVTHNGYRGLPDSGNPDKYNALGGDRITKTAINLANDYPAYATYAPVAGGRGDVNRTLNISYIENMTERQRINCEAKLKTLNFIYYMQHDLGASNWSISDEGFNTPYNEQQLCPNIPAEFKAIEREFPPFPYVRESRRIISVHTLTAKEIKRLNGRQIAFTPSSIAIGDYGMDKHNCAQDATLEQDLGETRADIDLNGYFQVPMETLIPAQLDGFLAVEKNLGASRLAEGALRLQPISMETGQAAGVLAALAIQKNVQPRAVNFHEVQKALLDNRAFISTYNYADIPITHARWKDVQLASANGYMIGYGTGSFGPSDPLTRAQAGVVMARIFNYRLDPPATPSFVDVQPQSWGYAQIEALKREGVTRGCAADPARYCPTDPITRWQLAAFLTRAYHIDTTNVAKVEAFNDVSTDQDPIAQIAIANGWFEPCGDATFCPNQAVTRGEMATIIAKHILE